MAKPEKKTKPRPKSKAKPKVPPKTKAKPKVPAKAKAKPKIPPKAKARVPAKAKPKAKPAARAKAPAPSRAPARSPEQLSLGAFAEPAARKLPAIGGPAPAFDLPADDGKRYSLAGLRGQRFVLYFYPKDNTPGCTTEACDFRDRAAAFRKKGTVVLGVSPDGLPAHAGFRRKFDLPFPLLSDPDHAVAEAFGAWGKKVLYGRASLGIVRSTFVVDGRGRIERVYSPVRVPGHVDAVLAALG